VIRTDDLARRGLRRWTVAAIVTVVLAALAVTATFTPLFQASALHLRGIGTIPREEFLRLAGVRAGTNVFHLDTRAVEHRLENDPRILEARVTTRLPGDVFIHVIRRSPVAVVGIPRALVGADGVVIGPAAGVDHLPVLTSEGGAPPEGDRLHRAAAVAAAMSPGLRRAVEAVSIGRGGGLEVRLRAGFSADLGDATELRAKTASLVALLEWAEERGVTVLAADLTVPGSPTAQLDRAGASVSVP
jgi:cell division septal protein FtsQ